MTKSEALAKAREKRAANTFPRRLVWNRLTRSMGLSRAEAKPIFLAMHKAFYDRKKRGTNE